MFGRVIVGNWEYVGRGRKLAIFDFDRQRGERRTLYENFYSASAAMENRVKEQQ